MSKKKMFFVVSVVLFAAMKSEGMDESSAKMSSSETKVLFDRVASDLSDNNPAADPANTVLYGFSLVKAVERGKLFVDGKSFNSFSNMTRLIWDKANIRRVCYSYDVKSVKTMCYITLSDGKDFRRNTQIHHNEELRAREEQEHLEAKERLRLRS